MTTLAEIYESMMMLDIMTDLASFSCYHDGIIVYQLQKSNIDVEISLICDDFLCEKEEPIDLINMNKIQFFQLTVFEVQSGKMITDKKYSINASMN